MVAGSEMRKVDFFLDDARLEQKWQLSGEVKAWDTAEIALKKMH